MATTRVFKSGNSQAVRLPKKFRVKTKEVDISRRGEEIVLREKPLGMEKVFDLIASLPLEITHIRGKKDRPQKRKGL